MLWCANNTSPCLGIWPATDQPPIRTRQDGGATRPGGDARGAPPGAAGDARDAGGVNGLRQGYIEQHGGDPGAHVDFPVPPGGKVKTRGMKAVIAAR
jgi:hypothetical protein